MSTKDRFANINALAAGAAAESEHDGGLAIRCESASIRDISQLIEKIHEGGGI